MTDPVVPTDYTQATRRPNYFDGRLITAADLRQDQEYHRGMRYLQNRALGWGIVEGLDVSATAAGITISTGFAIDVLGRELVLAEPQFLAADDPFLLACPDPVVTATWAEVPDGQTPGAPGPDGSTDVSGGTFTTWLEQPLIRITPANSVQPPAIVLARIRRYKKKPPTVEATGRNMFRWRGRVSIR